MKNYFYIQLNKGLADHQSSENLKLDNSSDWTQTISHFPGLTWTLFILIPSFKKVLNEENHSRLLVEILKNKTNYYKKLICFLDLV